MAEEALLLRLGHQVQRGAGKAAAMHAVRAAIVQHVFGHGQRHAQGLLGAVLGVHVLQVHPAAAAGFNQDALDLVDLIGLDGIDQRVHAVVFIVIMQGAQQGAVARLAAHTGHLLPQLLGTHAAQGFLAKAMRHLVHFAADRAVFLRQVIMAAAGVDHDQRIAARGKIILQRRYLGLRLEIDGDQAAHGGGHLIHQPAGLAKINVFGILGNLGALDGIHLHAVIQRIENGADQHLKGGGG